MSLAFFCEINSTKALQILILLECGEQSRTKYEFSDEKIKN